MSHSLMNVENQTMKVANLLLSGLVVAAMGFMATGCNENPSEPNDPGEAGAPAQPTNLMATSIGASQVALSWTAPVDTGVITYLVAWAPVTGGTASDSGSADVATTSHTVNGLATNLSYKFYVYSVRSSKSSAATTIEWAGAVRFTTEPGSSTTIRMYETKSNSGSGLTLDPPNGPKNVSVGASNPNPGSVNLAIYTSDDQPTTFDIGAAYAFIEYRNANNFDQNTYISDSSYPATSLSTWYSSGSIAPHIPNDGNIRYFRLPIAQTSNGQGFYVRTGTAGDYNYARVFIKNVGGKLLQGTAPSRYIEVDVSYQTNANVPYAKTAAHAPTPANVGSQLGPVGN